MHWICKDLHVIRDHNGTACSFYNTVQSFLHTKNSLDQWEETS